MKATPLRFIIAYAGSTLISIANELIRTVHPHVYGEHHYAYLMHTGSSSCMRETLNV